VNLDLDFLGQRGYARLPAIRNAAACAEPIALYSRAELFRSQTEIARYRFGAGDCRYFDYPLPEMAAALRERSYPQLSAANAWNEALGDPMRFSPDLAAFYPRMPCGPASALPPGERRPRFLSRQRKRREPVADRHAICLGNRLSRRGMSRHDTPRRKPPFKS